MNFTEFQRVRPRLLAEHSGLIDAAETNLYRALAQLVPGAAPATSDTVHRCDLARQWTELFDLPREWTHRAFVSCGVRDSLARLLDNLTPKTSHIRLPEDNYPVYNEIATSHGLSPTSFSTLPNVRWPDNPPHTRKHEWLLVTNPLKPRGRHLKNSEAAGLQQWLAASPRRRVVLDTVYTLDSRFDAVTLSLLATNQVILLHSLTKGWLHPRCFGIALMPEADAAEWKSVFQKSPPPQENLITAHHLMTRHPYSPTKVAQALSKAQRELRETVGNKVKEFLPVDETSYLIPVKHPWEDLRAQGGAGPARQRVRLRARRPDHPQQLDLYSMIPLDCLPIYEDAEFYDLEFAGRQHEIPYFSALASRAPGPVLEVACGTGRITIPIAQQGVDIAGLDVSPSMIARARQNAAETGVEIPWIEQDCRNMRLDRSFALIFSATNAMQHLLDVESVSAFLSGARKALQPGGRLVIDVFNPSITKLLKTPADRHVHKTIPVSDGPPFTVEVSSEYLADRQVLHFDLFYLRAGQLERTKHVNMRVFFPQELIALCQFNGFRVIKRHGDYDGNEFYADSPKQILICQK